MTGRLDAFEWKDPLAGDDHAGALIEAEAMGMLAHRDHTSVAVPAVERSTKEQRGSGEISAGYPATARQADEHTEAAAPAQQGARAMPIPRRSRSLRPFQ